MALAAELGIVIGQKFLLAAMNPVAGNAGNRLTEMRIAADIVGFGMRHMADLTSSDDFAGRLGSWISDVLR